MMQHAVRYVECPRDAMQGWPHPIDTDTKVAYINQLLQVGFDTLDCLSFVSPKAIPQMADSHEVVKRLDLSATSTRLLAIVANARGAADAAQYDAISFLGFPFSISPSFQQRNANSTIEESWGRVQQIQEICLQKGKELVIYFSMAFGNPYGDAFDAGVINTWIEKMAAIGIRIFSLADTVGLATPEEVAAICEDVVARWPQYEIGAHLHSQPHSWKPKLEAALAAGCTRVDGALKGVGGCPLAGDALVGNMNTELILPYLLEKNLVAGINNQVLAEAAVTAGKIFY